MSKSYSFPMHANILYALDRHNNIAPGARFSLLDAAILCFVKSFHENCQPFYISNKELSSIFLADANTIQRSLDRLVAAGLITKRKEYVGKVPRRYLDYCPEAVDMLLREVY